MIGYYFELDLEPENQILMHTTVIVVYYGPPSTAIGRAFASEAQKSVSRIPDPSSLQLMPFTSISSGICDHNWV